MYHQPYIGITDFTTADQAAKMRKVLDDEGCNHLLHVGVMMSYKTLRGLETKWKGIYPPKEALQDIFVAKEDVLNVLHYADYDDKTSAEDLIEALNWAGPAVETIQLDMPWPDPLMLQSVWRERLESGKETNFIIQVSKRALEEVDMELSAVVLKLLNYRMHSCLQYVLFDMSGGKGVPLKAQNLLDYIWASYFQLPEEIGIAIAGGLGPTTMDLAEPIVRDLHREGIPVSFDAQSRLRPSINAMDPIDWVLAADYLREAAKLLKKHSPI